MEQVIEVVDSLVKSHAITGPFYLFSATSLRAEKLAQPLSAVLGVTEVRKTCLNSIDSGSVAGLNREQMEEVVPGYFHTMKLYETGAMNAYSIKHPGEPLVDFEKKVTALLDEIECKKDGTAFVVLHKSAETAALIHYARRMGKYPRTFFGYIKLDTANASVIDIVGERINILCINVPCDELPKNVV